MLYDKNSMKYFYINCGTISSWDMVNIRLPNNHHILSIRFISSSYTLFDIFPFLIKILLYSTAVVSDFTLGAEELKVDALQAMTPPHSDSSSPMPSSPRSECDSNPDSPGSDNNLRSKQGWPQMGRIWDFLKISFSTFGWPILKNPRFVSEAVILKPSNFYTIIYMGLLFLS